MTDAPLRTTVPTWPEIIREEIETPFGFTVVGFVFSALILPFAELLTLVQQWGAGDFVQDAVAVCVLGSMAFALLFLGAAIVEAVRNGYHRL